MKIATSIPHQKSMLSTFLFVRLDTDLQQAFELFGNGLSVFQNSLNPGASGGLWTPDQGFALDGPTVGLAAPWPPASFSGFQLWATFTPDICKYERTRWLTISAKEIKSTAQD